MNHIKREWSQNRRMKGYYRKLKEQEDICLCFSVLLNWIPNLEMFKFYTYLDTELILRTQAVLTPIE